jgi:uncharacterized LabA/DUF88 family protein
LPSYDFGYLEIVEFLKRDYQVIRGYYYDGAEHHSQRSTGKRQFFDLLRKLGITLRLKEIDFAKPNHSQKGVDIFLTADMISLAYEDAYDVAVLVSGDGDYEALVELVKSKGKRVVVISFRNCLSIRLRECADQVVYFEDTRALDRKNPPAGPPPPTKPATLPSVARPQN